MSVVGSNAGSHLHPILLSVLGSNPWSALHPVLVMKSMVPFTPCTCVCCGVKCVIPFTPYTFVCFGVKSMVCFTPCTCDEIHGPIYNLYFCLLWGLIHAPIYTLYVCLLCGQLVPFIPCNGPGSNQVRSLTASGQNYVLMQVTLIAPHYMSS